jgi:hypothetical protein
MKNWDSLPKISPSSHEEIFFLFFLTNDSGVVEPFRSKMFEYGAVQIRVLNAARKIVICGTKDFGLFSDDFEQFFQAYGDKANLAKVFEYSGGFGIGHFQSDSIYSGNCLSELRKEFDSSFQLPQLNGTLGGFFHDDAYTYVVTAAHCLYGLVPVSIVGQDIYAQRDE